jgi:hypothetical protein
MVGADDDRTRVTSILREIIAGTERIQPSVWEDGNTLARMPAGRVQ